MPLQPPLRTCLPATASELMEPLYFGEINYAGLVLVLNMYSGKGLASMPDFRGLVLHCTPVHRQIPVPRRIVNCFMFSVHKALTCHNDAKQPVPRRKSFTSPPTSLLYLAGSAVLSRLLQQLSHQLFMPLLLHSHHCSSSVLQRNSEYSLVFLP